MRGVYIGMGKEIENKDSNARTRLNMKRRGREGGERKR